MPVTANNVSPHDGAVYTHAAQRARVAAWVPIIRLLEATKFSVGEVLRVERFDEDDTPADAHDAVMGSQAKVAGCILCFFVRWIVEECYRVFEAGVNDVSVGRDFLEFGEWRVSGEANDWLAIDDLRCHFVDSTAFDVLSTRFRCQRFECAQYASLATALAWRFVVLALEATALAVGFAAGSTLHVLPGI